MVLSLGNSEEDSLMEFKGSLDQIPQSYRGRNHPGLNSSGVVEALDQDLLTSRGNNGI